MHNPVVVLSLIVAANWAPIVTCNMLGCRFAWPLDGGKRWLDGRPILGSSKTLRGVLCAVLAAVLCGLLLNVRPAVGAVVGVTAMAGDMLSSFAKRRMGKESGGQVMILDHVPEALLPLLATRRVFAMTWAEIAFCTGAFVALGLVGSRVLYRFNLRKHPY